MARMANATSPQMTAIEATWAGKSLALIPKHRATGDTWSIDAEPIGESWFDSSWILSRGLQVIEGLTLEPMAQWLLLADGS